MEELHNEGLVDYNPEDEYKPLDDASSEPPIEPKAHADGYPPFCETEPANDGIPNFIPRQYNPPTEPEPEMTTELPAQPPTPQPVQQPAPQPPQQAAPAQQPQQVYYTQPVAYVQPPYQQPVYPQYQQPVMYQPVAPQPAQQVYRQPYAQPYPPYEPFPKKEKKKMSGGTIAFLVILAFVTVSCLVALAGYVVYNSLKADQGEPDDRYDSNGFSQLIPDDGNNGAADSSAGEFEQEITLVADNGETQQRDTDDEDNIYVPEEDAESIELLPLPNDAKDPKYTTQSAYDSVCDAVVSVLTYNGEITEDYSTLVGQGTGTIISKDGYIITNAHVIGNSRSYLVNIILNNEKEYQAKIVGYDTWTDLALLKIDAKDLTAVKFGDSDLIEIGQDVIAIGNPGGTAFKNSLTKGVVSAVGRELTINKNVEYIQSDAVINPGNSGGPLCNIYGQVIGINSAKISSEVYESMTFSIPSKTVKATINDLMHYGFVKGRTRIGFSGFEISAEDVYYYGYPQGVMVEKIDESGSLAGTDIKEGDIITAIDGTKITSFQDIFDILSGHKEGDKVKLTVYRPETY